MTTLVIVNRGVLHCLMRDARATHLPVATQCADLTRVTYDMCLVIARDFAGSSDYSDRVHLARAYSQLVMSWSSTRYHQVEDESRHPTIDVQCEPIDVPPGPGPGAVEVGTPGSTEPVLPGRDQIRRELGLPLTLCDLHGGRVPRIGRKRLTSQVSQVSQDPGIIAQLRDLLEAYDSKRSDGPEDDAGIEQEIDEEARRVLGESGSTQPIDGTGV